jgi:hypothetical protein
MTPPPSCFLTDQLPIFYYEGAGVDYTNHIATATCHPPQIFGPSTPSAGCRIVMRFSQFKLGGSYVRRVPYLEQRKKGPKIISGEICTLSIS